MPDPIPESQRKLHNMLAESLDTILNGQARGKARRTGFVLLTFPFGEDDKSRVNYISNAERTDMIVALKEIVARFEGRVVEPPVGVKN